MGFQCLRAVTERLGEDRYWGGLSQFIEGAQAGFEGCEDGS